MLKTRPLIPTFVVLTVLSNIVTAESPDKTASTQSEGSAKYINPAIQNYGRIVQLPDAVHQPRSGSKIVVDVTAKGEADQVNPALSKACRFVNLYAGGGKQPAHVQISLVLHGDATLTILDDDAYNKRFSIMNPNMDCLKKLRGAGVEIFVCGQALTGKGIEVAEVSSHANVAVSALTALVNLQTAGYAYIPLFK